MLSQAKAILSRQDLSLQNPSLLEDVFGVASLFFLLFVGLTLSGAA